jgi:hypothetical protein
MVARALGLRHNDRMRLAIFTCVLGLTAAAPQIGHAAEIDLGLGANYWTDPRLGVFDLDLRILEPIAHSLAVGGRLGGLIAAANGTTDFGIPLDIDLHISVNRIYFDVLGGPWILFGGGTTVRAHAAFGFGLQASSISFGLEVGYLDPGAMIGLRLAFRI